MASTDARPSKRAKVDYTDTIQVLVGAKESAFTVYKDTITKRSPFFRAALGHDFKEAHERRVRLPDCDRETFNTYLECLYHEGQVLDELFELFPGDFKEKHENYGEYLEQQYFQLTKLYILADQLRDIRLCNEVIEHLIYMGRSHPNAQTVTLVYETFLAEHGMRHFILTLCMMQCDQWWLIKNRASLPADFIFDYAIELREFTELQSFTDFDERDGIEREKCFWHQHDADVPECESEDEEE